MFSMPKRTKECFWAFDAYKLVEATAVSSSPQSIHRIFLLQNNKRFTFNMVQDNIEAQYEEYLQFALDLGRKVILVKLGEYASF
jgi:hypothetical protein